MMASALTITNNLIWCSEIALRLSPEKKAYVEHNAFLGLSTLNMKQLRPSDTVINNIFSGVRFNNFSDNMLFFAYNSIDSIRGEAPLGVGTPALQNTKGDSCDYYFNICGDSFIDDSSTGALLPGSPCIGAASDGTDIGVYHSDDAGVKPEYRGKGPSRSHQTIAIRLGRRIALMPMDARNTFSPGNYTISLFTVQGRRISVLEGRIVLNEGIFIINTDNRPLFFPPGCYLVQISGSDRRYCFHVLFE
ncbi:MAG: hypothetical protein JXA18_06565 [Chitinispirillaceae bacterium]|nr:hypothetical protein [Chitinispirillaceae bacterium]